ncbi:MAG: hypothetical protein Q4F66_12840, partial [Clostridium sp.]|nr:hypothetical protein [Clostridium sp.]
LLVDSENNLYLGTANPYSGCEVFKGSKMLTPSISIRSFLNNFPLLYNLQNELDNLYIDFLKDVLSNSAISDLFKM